MKFVSILMGSKSDYGVMEECAKTLEKFGVMYEIVVSSAHRSPDRTHQYVKNAEAKFENDKKQKELEILSQKPKHK
jgi:5-(carboxyamino)imidazole ribonucleotide mutase